jgi:ribonuclease R
MIGSRSGRTFRLGDSVEVRLAEAAPVAGALRFELLSEGQPGAKARPRDGANRFRNDRPPFSRSTKNRKTPSLDKKKKNKTRKNKGKKR